MSWKIHGGCVCKHSSFVSVLIKCRWEDYRQSGTHSSKLIYPRTALFLSLFLPLSLSSHIILLTLLYVSLFFWEGKYFHNFSLCGIYNMSYKLIWYKGNFLGRRREKLWWVVLGLIHTTHNTWYDTQVTNKNWYIFVPDIVYQRRKKTIYIEKTIWKMRKKWE